MEVKIYRMYGEDRYHWDSFYLHEPPYSYTSAVYELPEGYTIAESNTGEDMIYDKKDLPCEVFQKSLNSNVLVVTSASGSFPLKEVRNPIRNVLKTIRMSKNITQQELATASGVNIRQIQRVESGESDIGNLTAKNFLSIADALCVDPKDLI